MATSRAPTLDDYLATYLQRRSLRSRSRNALRTSVSSLTNCRGSLSLAAITPAVLNEWVACLERTHKAATVITHRANVLTLLRAAADDDLIHEPNARKIRRPRTPKPLPQAWSHEQLQRLLSAAQDLSGWLRPPRECPACLYFTGLIRVAYETGLRRGNLFSLRQEDVRDDGTIYVAHEKTGQPHIVDIEAATVAIFRKLPGTQPLRWKNGNTYRRWWRRLCDDAGIPQGGLHKIRKTAATLVWLEDEDNPSRVQRFLGHLTPDMWRRYVDTSQGVKRPPRPPRLSARVS